MGKRADQKEKRRQQILECCLELFVHKGYSGTTVRDIAEKAEMSVGLLFHYFPTKQAILEELINMAQSGVSSMTMLLSQPASPIECFEHIADQIFKSFREFPMTAGIFMLVNQTFISDLVPDNVKQTLKPLEAIEHTIPVIEEGQRLGCIKIGDPYALSLAFWGAIQGIAESLVWYPHFPVPEANWIVDILRAT